MKFLSLHSPVGDLTLFAEDNHLISIEWGWSSIQERSSFLEDVKDQLIAYFVGQLKQFDVSMKFEATDHQQKVWQEMVNIPYGEVITYSDLANSIGSHARAVGMACGKNPIPLIIPCHRIIGKSGQLTGYSGGEGIETKKYLINLEKTYLDHKS